MHTRRASYSPDAIAETHDPQTSPRRRKLNASSVMAVDGESLIQSQYNQEEDIDESSDEYISQLLRQAEENLATKGSIRGPVASRISPDVQTPSNLSLVPKNKVNKLLTDQLEDSVILSAADGTIKRLLPPLSRQQKEKIKGTTAGEKWFDMPATEVTPSLKRDLTLLQMRDVLDPKRHYRASAKKLPKFFQMGSIIESPTEYFSARIKKKDRKQTIVEELLADQKGREYFKKKYSELQEKSASGGKKWYKKMQERKKRK